MSGNSFERTTIIADLNLDICKRMYDPFYEIVLCYDE